MNEVWKDVVGYEGLYEVSNSGKVRMLRNGNSHYMAEKRCQKNNKGYLTTMLSNKDRSRKRWLVHRLVAIAFLPNPNNYPYINHKDENKENNSVDNLEWCDNRYNVLYSLERHERATPNTRNGKRKHMRVIQCTMDGEVIREWENAREVFRETGMSDCSVTSCCLGKRNMAYGYKWRYAI